MLNMLWKKFKRQFWKKLKFHKIVSKFPWKPNKVYMLPTRNGVILFGAATILLIVGLTYANNLILFNAIGLLLLFSFSSIITHFNLVGVSLLSLEIDSGHADLPVIAKVILQNKTVRTQQNVCVKIVLDSGATLMLSDLTIPADETNHYRQMTQVLKRGQYKLSKIILQTNFPLGIFYAWSYPVEDHCAHAFYVYPEAKGDCRLEECQRHFPHLLNAGQLVDIDEFLYHEEFIAGMPFARVDWKAYAKRGKLLSKKFSYEQIFNGYEVTISLEEKDIEKSLQRASKLIGLCHRYKLWWRLVLPHYKTEFDVGIVHYQKCMKELACYEV